MPLIDAVSAICQGLANKGWSRLLHEVAGLDIHLKGSELAAELHRELEFVDRAIPGFEDFAMEGRRAIEPGQPCLSLLFHAFAKPQLGCMSGRYKTLAVHKFPTAAELEVIENYVYGANPPSIAELRRRAGSAPLALITCVAEYRPVAQTVHRKHADMCYSLSGVGRIGTQDKKYNKVARGYTSLTRQKNQVPVVPVRYSAYLAARIACNASSEFGPLSRIQTAEKNSLNGTTAPDSSRSFWVPLHKVFSGEECLRDLNLHLEFTCDHRNEKLRRAFRRKAGRRGVATYPPAAFGSFPFVIPQNELVKVQAVLPGGKLAASSVLVTPKPSPLVEPAEYKGKPVSIHVTAKALHDFGSIHIKPSKTGGRSAPEFIYVKTQVNGKPWPDNGSSYDAQLFIDRTGDGWIRARCQELELDIPQSIPAYSILAAPDPYPAVKQHDVYDWWRQSVPPELRNSLFGQGDDLPVEPLSDARLAANITYRQGPSGAPLYAASSGRGPGTSIFDPADATYTAIVGPADGDRGGNTPLTLYDDQRVSALADGAAGLFAPGWDVSIDTNSVHGKKVMHLAAYGGGLPFLEDARICAALSGFWPAVAPDTARLYADNGAPSVTPIPDSLLGWDGLKAPKVVMPSGNYPGTAEQYAIDDTDYIRRYRSKGLDLRRVQAVTLRDYKSWTLTMARVYQALGAVKGRDKSKWTVLSFDTQKVKKYTPDRQLKTALAAAKSTLANTYYFLLAQPLNRPPVKKGTNRMQVRFKRWVRALASPGEVWFWDSAKPGWRHREF